MIRRLLNRFQQLGFKTTCKRLLEFILLQCGVRVTFSTIDKHKIKRASSVFNNRKVVQSKNGYWRLDPMPSEKELNTYYENAYWDNRGGKLYGANARDLSHWRMIQDILKYDASNKTIVNFGAGHGGISHLFWNAHADIVNIEPSGLPIAYKERWRTVSHIKDVSDNSVDFLYGSHSLEHVRDIDEFWREARRILVPDGLIFMEVPNGEHPSNSAILGNIHIPHTYYFTKQHFENVLGEIIMCETFAHYHQLGFIEHWAEHKMPLGNVIRVLGRLNKK